MLDRRRPPLRAALLLLIGAAATASIVDGGDAREARRAELLATLPLDVTGQQIDVPDDAALEEHLATNVKEHRSEAAATCEHFHCAAPEGAGLSADAFDAYPMASVPSIDFPKEFADRDAIYVSKQPLFSAEECEEVIRLAELEGIGLPATKSGKYQLGKAWIKDMPSVLAWFNGALSKQLFPTLSKLFPAVLPDPATLRAHSVAVLKYNSSHPRTDVHVDDALFAFTIALSPASSFEGGGTYMEHLETVLEMPQGHATFRPGAVRHAGAAVVSGVRYVIGGFIAVADKVEHVRRLNERGNRILLGSPDDADRLKEAAQLFEWGLLLNANCSLCHQNLGDTYLRLERPADAAASLRRQIALLPRDSDAYFALGHALRGQMDDVGALEAYDAAVALTPTDYESHVARADVLHALGRPLEEIAATREALALKPNDVRLWLNIGVAYSNEALDDVEQAEAAFRKACEVAPEDARPPLNLGRYLAKLSRPQEAIETFYDAAAIDAEYFDEVKLGVGTARAQQGRLKQATEAFQSAARMKPSNEKLQSSLAEMQATLAEVEAFSEGRSNAVDDLCGTPCQDIVDTSGVNMVCGITWADGCGEDPPPAGFTPQSKVSELCGQACAFYAYQQQKQQQQQQQQQAA